MDERRNLPFVFPDPSFRKSLAVDCFEPNLYLKLSRRERTQRQNCRASINLGAALQRKERSFMQSVSRIKSRFHRSRTKLTLSSTFDLSAFVEKSAQLEPSSTLAGLLTRCGIVSPDASQNMMPDQLVRVGTHLPEFKASKCLGHQRFWY